MFGKYEIKMENLFELCKKWALNTISDEESEEVKKYFQEYVNVDNIKELHIKCCMETIGECQDSRWFIRDIIEVQVNILQFSGNDIVKYYEIHQDNSVHDTTNVA